MYNPYVLIISKRKELAIRYKKILKLLSAEAFLTDNLSDAISKIRRFEFEFIIVSDTIEEDIKSFIKQVRVLTYNFRPTIIAISKSAELSDKLELLNSGADDFLSETMTNKEFQARINAHIRRHVENLTSPLTGFLNERLTRKVLRQKIEKEEKISTILVSIDKIESYKEIYGEIAAEKVLQTTGAIISSALSKEDTIGHYSMYDFIVFTNPYRAEKLAEFFAFAFDNVLNRFYSEYDYNNNFILYSSNTKEEKKISLMKLIAAVQPLEKGMFNSELDVIQSLYGLLKPLKNGDKSAFIVDRPKLCGDVDDIKRNKILIMENDEALGLLIETTCTINGYCTRLCESYDCFIQSLSDYKPDLIILDWGQDNEMAGIKALDRAKNHYEKTGNKMPVVIFSTNILDKETILAHGADFYLPKPYDIQTLIKILSDYLEG